MQLRSQVETLKQFHIYGMRVGPKQNTDSLAAAEAYGNSVYRPWRLDRQPPARRRTGQAKTPRGAGLLANANARPASRVIVWVGGRGCGVSQLQLDGCPIVTVIATRDHSCGTHGALAYVRCAGGAEAAKARARKALCSLEWWVDAPLSTHNCKELPSATTN